MTRKGIYPLATILLALAGMFVVLEAVVRVGGWGFEYLRFSNHSYLYFTNPRGYYSPVTTENGRPLYGVPFSVDPEGYRLPDTDMAPAQPPADQGGPSILVLGDSFTWGRGVRYPDAWPVRFSELLNQAGCPARVENAALVGEDIAEIVAEYATQQARALDRGRKWDLVVYAFVLNDFGRDAPGGIQGLDFIDFNNGTFSYSFIRDHSALVNLILGMVDRIRLHKTTVKAYLDAFSGPEAEKKFAKVADLHRRIEANGQRLVILLFPLLYDFEKYPFAEVHAKTRNLCQKEGIPFLDLLPAFSLRQDRELWAHPMDHHPNELGHRIAADQLFRFLESRPDLLPCPPAQPPGESGHAQTGKSG